MLEWGNLDLDFWRTCATWPGDQTSVLIIAGGGGHDHEITVTFCYPDPDPAWPSGPIYGYGEQYEYQPDYLVGLFKAALPEGWKADDRGTRIELHPSGRRYSGWNLDDVAAVQRAAEELGFTHRTTVYDRG